MDKSTDNEKKRRRQAVVDELKAVGVKGGVLRTMAETGQFIKVRCETPKCYREEGRGFPRPPGAPNAVWSPTVDHYPTLKMNGGHKDPWNVRLSHKKCNNEDYAWRERITRMSREGKSLQEMADRLNSKGVRGPKGSRAWTAASVRWTFVSS
jgi:hypothetical protein